MAQLCECVCVPGSVWPSYVSVCSRQCVAQLCECVCVFQAVCGPVM